MTSPTFPFLLIFSLSILHKLHALGSASTIAAVSSPRTVCGIVAGEPTRRIECFTDGGKLSILPNISYDSLAAGPGFFCALRSGGTTLLCWDHNTTGNRKRKRKLRPKRIYFSQTLTLREISVADDQVCAVVNSTNKLKCWRATVPIPPDEFRSVSSGVGFSCGTLTRNGPGNLKCWGTNSTLASQIQGQFRNFSLSSIAVGATHACGCNSADGTLICKSSNESIQFDPPIGETFSQIALGFGFSCGIRKSNRTVACWGQLAKSSINSAIGVSFEVITAGLDFVCGLSSANFSVICWGLGYPPLPYLENLPLSTILPGKCVQSSCKCGTYPESDQLCSGSGEICNQCDLLSPLLTPLKSSSSPSQSQSNPRKGEIFAFLIVGSIGGLAGFCTIVYCVWIGVCCVRKKVHNSVQPRITRAGSNTGRFSSNSPPSRSLTIKRQCSRVLGRQRSGTSSSVRAEEFSFSDLAAATDGFSIGRKIGAGSFGVVYRGRLVDGREVAIKRGETSQKAKKFQQKEIAFDSEVGFLSRLHHKHLVRLVGFCQEHDERILVYEYMKNGALYDHLHGRGKAERGSSLVNSWKLRIKIALDSARGIEYLHNYAVPPIIHRDIKSSNILLDSSWTARVSDFGLSLMGPDTEVETEAEAELINLRPSKAAGTVGYIDPEYYGLNVLTAKSDVYGLGVVLLELLTGKRAIFKAEEYGGAPTSVVDYAVPRIMVEELSGILDPRVGPLETNESEAVELVAYTAMHCVNLEGKDRPTMSDIVANLDRALALCEESRKTISSEDLSIGSELV